MIQILKKAIPFAFSVILAFAFFGLAACNNDPNPDLTGTVTIDGTAMVGQELTADITDLNGTGTVFYQWKRNGTNIPDAKDYTYELVDGDFGAHITVTVSCAGYSGSISSDGIGPVAADNLPEIEGDVWINGFPVVDQTLTADNDLIGTGTIS